MNASHPLFALLNSRKAWIAVLSIVAVVALAALGKVDGAGALDFVKWLVSAWIGSVALEDAGTRRAPAADTPPAVQ